MKKLSVFVMLAFIAITFYACNSSNEQDGSITPNTTQSAVNENTEVAQES